MLPIEVRPVRARRDVTGFLDAAENVYRDDPGWAAPLRHSMRRTMSSRHNPFHREATIDHFVARDRDGRVVGRVAATLHHAYIERYGPSAFFGFFECVNDSDVARALLYAVESWASERGAKRVAGPYGYTGTQEVGLLVSGFDQAPALMQPYNPSYYVDLLEQAGYQAAFQMASYTWHAEADPALAKRLVERGDEVLRANGLAVRTVHMRRYDDELERLRQVYNRSFANHPEHISISAPVFRAQAAELRSVVDPELVRIVEQDGAVVAFLLLVPNLSELLRDGTGRITPRLVWRLAARRRYRIRGISSAVVVMMGATPEFVGKGAGRVLGAEIVRTSSGTPYRTVTTTWVHEDNRWCRAVIQLTRARPSKHYAVFEKLL